MRRHHHEDCLLCMQGKCDGSRPIDPKYPTGEPMTNWDVVKLLAFATAVVGAFLGTVFYILDWWLP